VPDAGWWPMQLSETEHGDIPLIQVRGEVDHYAAPVLAVAADHSLGPDGTRIVFDVSDCPYMDSGAVSVLLGLVKRLRGRGWVAVIGASPDLSRVFKTVGLTQEESFRVLASLDELGS
jgi:anti-anti-sigma factor